MSSQNPQVYYENEENHGNYVYVTLESIVNTFLLAQTGDRTVIGGVPRHLVLHWAKKGIQEFTFDALREVKQVELSLGDTLDIILPPDYINYVRISYVNEQTGALMPLSRNNKIALAASYLQDNNAEILFDDDGEILKGTTLHQALIDRPTNVNVLPILSCDTTCNGCSYYGSGCPNPTMFRADPTRNANGYFQIDTRQGKIHFSSDNASRTIMLEYISDGLEYNSDSDIRVNKLAETALYDYISWNILNNDLNVQEYIVQRAKKKYDTSYRNAKIRLMNLKPNEVIFTLRGRNKYIR